MFLFLSFLLVPVGAMFHQHRHIHINATMEVLLPLLKAASFVAEQTQPPKPKGESIFDLQGNIYDVIDEVRYFAQIANLPNVTTICETGFNAGHSAITFLAANPQSKVYSFDLGDMPWATKSVEFVSYLFPDRFVYIKGRSGDTIREDALPEGTKCDLFSVDGDHMNAWVDFSLGPKICRPGAYIVADDYISSGGTVIRDWRRAERQGLFRTLDCHQDAYWMTKVGGYFKGWCLGQYAG